MTARHQQLIATLTLALAFSAVLTSSAQAADRPDNRPGSHGIGSPNNDLSDVFTRAVARPHAVQAARPDDRAGLRGAATTSLTPIILFDVFERAVLRHNATAVPRPDDRAGLRGDGGELAYAAPIAKAASTGFQWTDAGLGAATALALVLVLAGLGIARASHHRSHAILD